MDTVLLINPKLEDDDFLPITSDQKAASVNRGDNKTIEPRLDVSDVESHEEEAGEDKSLLPSSEKEHKFWANMRCGRMLCICTEYSGNGPVSLAVPITKESLKLSSIECHSNKNIAKEQDDKIKKTIKRMKKAICGLSISLFIVFTLLVLVSVLCPVFLVRHYRHQYWNQQWKQENMLENDYIKRIEPEYNEKWPAKDSNGGYIEMDSANGLTKITEFYGSDNMFNNKKNTIVVNYNLDTVSMYIEELKNCFLISGIPPVLRALNKNSATLPSDDKIGNNKSEIFTYDNNRYINSKYSGGWDGGHFGNGGNTLERILTKDMAEICSQNVNYRTHTYWLSKTALKLNDTDKSPKSDGRQDFPVQAPRDVQQQPNQPQQPEQQQPEQAQPFSQQQQNMQQSANLIDGAMIRDKRMTDVVVPMKISTGVWDKSGKYQDSDGNALGNIVSVLQGKIIIAVPVRSTNHGNGRYYNDYK